VVLDAPSNLGLLPPVPGAVPGCYKAPWALRDAGLLPRLGASDAGAVVPPRHDLGGWRPGAGVGNAAAIATFSTKLADRMQRYVAAGEFLVVLGGDRSVLLGAMLGLRRLGRYGLAFLDGHPGFRRPGGSPAAGAAGEHLALVTGRGQPDLADIERLAPYLRDRDVAVLGIRAADGAAAGLPSLGMLCLPASRLAGSAAAAGAVQALTRLETGDLAGFWVHLDVGVLDPPVMPAVDSPEPGGVGPEELGVLLSTLAASPACAGLEVTGYDPDLDPDGRHAALVTRILLGALLG
jgi:arginase